MTVAKMLVASTAHMNPADDIDRQFLLSWAREIEGGWLVPVNIVTVKACDAEKLSSGLSGLIEYAFVRNYDYILLDCDADEVSGFETYYVEWEG